MNIKQKYFPLQDETDKIIGTGIEIHKQLGFGFLEIVYKDAFEYEFTIKDVLYEREKQYDILYKNIILPHKFYADFVVFNKVILEIKAKGGIADEDMAQTLNYLKMFRVHSGSYTEFWSYEIGYQASGFIRIATEARKTTEHHTLRANPCFRGNKIRIFNFFCKEFIKIGSYR